MINSILIKNYFRTTNTRNFILNILKYILNIELEFDSKSIYKIKPSLYAYLIDNKIVFLEKEVEELKTISKINKNNKIINLEIYKNKLTEFLPSYIENLIKIKNNPLELVKLNFVLGKYDIAEKILNNILDTPETQMLKFYIQFVFYNKTLDKDDYLRFITICNSLDEQTRFVFVIDMLNFLEDNFLIYLENNDVNLIKYNHRIFLKIKIYEILIFKKNYKLAVYFLIKAIIEIIRPSDLELKYNLFRMVLELIDESWLIIFKDIIDKDYYNNFEKDDIKYLNYLTSSFNTNINIKIIPYEEIFYYCITKEKIYNCFIDKILIECDKEIIGLINKDNNFYQVVKLDNDKSNINYVAYLTKSIEITGICLKNGKIIEYNLIMKKIDRKTDIVIKEIENLEKIYRIKFKYKNEKICNFYIKNMSYNKSENGLIIDIDKSINYLEIYVEVDVNIFETKKYCFS